MPRRTPDLLDQHIALNIHDRQKRLAHPVFSDTKDIVARGSITTDLYLPPIIISMTPSFAIVDEINDRDPQEVKFLKAYCGMLHAGNATLRPKLNDQYVGDEFEVGDFLPTHWIRIYEDYEHVQDRDWLTFEVLAADGEAEHLSAFFLFEVRPGKDPAAG